jgi:hypothetical protein
MRYLGSSCAWAKPWIWSAMLEDVHDALLVMEQDTVLFLAEVQQPFGRLPQQATILSSPRRD